MAFVIKTSASATSGFAAPTGQSTQQHIAYAVNQGAYWAFWLSGTASLNALYSTNGGATWSAPSGSPFTLSLAHGGDGRNFGFGYANISAIDVLHMCAGYYNGGTESTTHTRFSLGTTWTNTNAEAANEAQGPAFTTLPSGPTTFVTSGGTVFDYYGIQSGSTDLWTSTHTDTGSSWTAGGSIAGNTYTGASSFSESTFIGGVASGTDALILADNGSAQNDFTDLNWTLVSVGRANSNSVFGTALTQTVDANWGACTRTVTDQHALGLANNSNSFSHRRYNGTSFSAGSTVPSLSLAANSGIALVTDGTSVWAFAFDTSQNLLYTKWSGSTWASWMMLEATRINTPSYITAVYSAANSTIMLAWSEVNGSNFDIIGSSLSTGGGGATRGLFFPATLSLGAGGAFFQAGVNS